MKTWNEDIQIALRGGKRVNVFAGLHYSYCDADARYFSKSGKVFYIPLKEAKKMARKERVKFVSMEYGNELQRST